MSAASYHPEDIRALLRKRYKSLAGFERAKGLPACSVRDVLRGKSRRRIADAIADELQIPVHELFPSASDSRFRDNSRLQVAGNPQNCPNSRAAK
jgi:lambda repressor-like predicted transcriptional regulator